MNYGHFGHDYITRDGRTPDLPRPRLFCQGAGVFKLLQTHRAKSLPWRPFEEGVIAWYTFLKQFQVAPQTDQIEGEENVLAASTHF